MDNHTGLNFKGEQNYNINRPLTYDEKSNRLRQDTKVCDDPLDWLSVIKVNNTYLELVDRWYHGKGAMLWLPLGIFIVCVAVVAGTFALVLTADKFSWGAVGAAALAFVLFGGLGWLSYLLMRLDIFRSTHYPIRLNRKTRTVYFLKPGGELLEANWDDLFICQKVNPQPVGSFNTMDARAHVLADDGETVLDTFTLATSVYGKGQDLMEAWEFARRYMEASDGVEKSCEGLTLCLPIDGRREGLVFGIFRVSAMATNFPVIQLLASPASVLQVFGRWLSMCTSKVPAWPKAVEDACRIDPNDPHVTDWRSNKPLTFLELGWPVLCFFAGLAAFGAVIYFFVSVLTVG